MSVLDGLYVILDPELALGRDLVEVAAAALAGGAKVLQLRAKHLDKGIVLPVARAIADRARAAGAVFVVNDHADLALAAGAHGVHIGQKDLPVPFLRSLLGPDAFIGCSAGTPDEARRAEAEGATYLGTGACYPTTSKEVTRPTGLAGLRKVAAATTLPVFGVGGIKLDNVAAVIESGAVGAAVITAVIAAPDVRLAVAALTAEIERARSARS